MIKLKRIHFFVYILGITILVSCNKNDPTPIVAAPIIHDTMMSYTIFNGTVDASYAPYINLKDALGNTVYAYRSGWLNYTASSVINSEVKLDNSYGFPFPPPGKYYSYVNEVDYTDSNIGLTQAGALKATVIDISYSTKSGKVYISFSGYYDLRYK